MTFFFFFLSLSLQDEFIQVQEEVRHLQAQLDRLQLQLAERTREILGKNGELDELRLQVN